MIYSECDQTATTNNTVTNSKTGQQQQNTTASPFSSSSSSSSASEYMANGVSPKYPAASFSVNSLLNPATAFGVLEETYRKHHQHPNAQTQFNPYQVSQSISNLEFKELLKLISKSVYLFRTTIMERAVNLTLNSKRSFSNKRIAADQQVIAQAQRRQQHRRLQQLQQTRQSRYNRPHHQ